MRAPRRTFPRQLRSILFLALLAGAASAGRAQTSGQLPQKWDESVRAIAEDIAAAASPARTIALEVKNISSLGAVDAAAIRRELESELGRRGIHFGTAPSTDVSVQVTLSESAERYILVGEIRAGDDKKIAVIDGPRAHDIPRAATPSMTLQRNLLWVQPEPILDFASRAILGGLDTQRTVLRANGLEIYRSSVRGNHGTMPFAPVSRMQASRDLRGRLTIGDMAHVEIRLARELCVSEYFARGIPDCGEEPGDGWSFPDGSESHFVAGRNYFGGFPISSDSSKTQPAFYGAATLSGDHASERIQTELDGKARLYWNWGAKSEAFFSGWGDDIATIKTGCDPGWQVIVTGTSDWTEPDRIQIYEIANHQATAIGQPLEFPGPIVSLWPEEDGKSARVVSRNLKTGMYEASIVSATCGN